MDTPTLPSQEDLDTNLGDPRLTRKEAVAIARRKLGVDEVTANFIVAIERGEIRGDVIEPGDPRPE